MTRGHGRSNREAIVFVVDADSSSRRSLHAIVRGAGWTPEVFAAPAAFLERPVPAVAHCLVLDVDLPGMTGFDLQSRMVHARAATPLVFVTATIDVPASVRAMRAGAVDFLLKPLDRAMLLASVELALAMSRATLARRVVDEELRGREHSLSRREREVMELVVAGLPNKQIASTLTIKEGTVKVHRAQVMQKMSAGSLPELVRAAQRLAPR